MKYLIVILIWVGFAFIHSLLIDLRFSKWASGVMGRYYAFYRLIYNLISLTLFIALLKYSRTLDAELVIKFEPPWLVLQYILLIASGLMIIWAFLSYDTLKFVGIRQITGVSDSKENTSSETITKKGLLGVVRHPMYLATIVFMWSLNSTWVDIVVHMVLTIYILIGIKLEERKLIKQFGLAYINYMREVPALIPFIKKVG